MLKNKNNYLFFSVIFTFSFLLIIIFIYNIFFIDVFKIPSCIIYDQFGIYCPACGCTRAAIALCNFNILASIKYNPIIVYSILSLLIYSGFKINYLLFKVKVPIFSNSKIYILLGIIIFIINCIYRNILLLIFNIHI